MRVASYQLPVASYESPSRTSCFSPFWGEYRKSPLRQRLRRCHLPQEGRKRAGRGAFSLCPTRPCSPLRQPPDGRLPPPPRGEETSHTFTSVATQRDRSPQGGVPPAGRGGGYPSDGVLEEASPQVASRSELPVTSCQADSEPNNWKRAWQASQLTPTRLLRPPVPRSLRPPRPSARGSS
jgi:hypothetical protein